MRKYKKMKWTLFVQGSKILTVIDGRNGVVIRVSIHGRGGVVIRVSIHRRDGSGIRVSIHQVREVILRRWGGLYVRVI